MKSTGVVRRIDDLGRIVIPKEIRKNLRIREGDTLEIFIDGSDIVLKKFSFISNLLETAKKLVDVSEKLISKNILITNMDKIVACNKKLEKKYLNQDLSSFIRERIEDRMDYFNTSLENVSFILGVEEKSYYTVYPIIVNSDLVGSVILFGDHNMENNDILLGKMLVSFLEKTLDD
ncbi:MAG: AbrB/MazE/SpoVT family DNA-binding domain-containing protein [Firmicutes bacterium]|nr:AbrB/MazE/SpoVT family DNA-binding domain-containing protein [Bacillota bacterium]